MLLTLPPGLSHRLAVGDDDDQNRLLESAVARRLEQEGLEDALVEGSSEARAAVKPCVALDKVLCRLL